MKFIKIYQKMMHFCKKNIKEILFLLLHLFLCSLVFVIFYFINEHTTFFVEIFEESFDIILDVSIALITIIISFEFLIKQIYFNRITKRIISGEIKVYIYQVLILFGYILLFSLFKSDDKLMCSIFISFLVTMALFFGWLVHDIENYELNKNIKRRVKKIILKIDKNGVFQEELVSLNQIYLDCVSKNETTICLQIISAYNDFIINFLCEKNKILLTDCSIESIVKQYEDDFLQFYIKAVLSNDRLESKRINLRIIECLILLYENACRCEDVLLVEKIQICFKQILFELNNLIDDYFAFFIVNFLGNPFNEVKEFFDYKLEFCLKFLNGLLHSRRISDYFFICDYFSNLIDANKNEIVIEKNLNVFLELLETMIFMNDGNTSYFVLLKVIDNFYLKINKYEDIIRFYENIISYKDFYDSEINILSWLNYYDDYIKNFQERELFILKYYSLYFKIITASVDRIEILPIHIIPKLSINHFFEIKTQMNELLHLLSIKEKISCLHHIFLSINDLCLSLKISNIEDQQGILEMYSTSFYSLINCTDSKTINFVIYNYLNLITEMDKNKLISKHLAEIIIKEMKDIVNEYIDCHNIFSDSFMKIFFAFVSGDNDFHFIKAVQDDLYKYIFEIGVKAIENRVDSFIKCASNFIGWGVYDALANNQFDIAKKYYKYGFDLFSTLVSLDYDDAVSVFVGTFFVTILSYCYAFNNKYQIIRFANEKIKEFDEKMRKVIYKSLSLRKDIAYTWNDIFNVDFPTGLKVLCSKINYKI